MFLISVCKFMSNRAIFFKLKTIDYKFIQHAEDSKFCLIGFNSQ